MANRSITRVAAVDLGSNSFHLFVARVIDNRLHIVDRLKQRVLLAAGLDSKGNLSNAAQVRALDCLAQFGQRLAHLPHESVRAVGTNTLRRARNAKSFLRRAQQALGHPIEVISGREEARLIYLGVAHSIAASVGRRLVIDIGGGSTECIVGSRFEPLAADSLYMGCVSFSLAHFPGGRIRRESIERAEIAARLEFETLASRYKSLKWKECVGSSGTILATEAILRANGWSRLGITRDGLSRLRKALIDLGHVNRLAQLRGLSEDRASVFPGGLAILNAAFDAFGITRMRTSTGALREGLAYDLLGRIGHEDIRNATIREFAGRYHVDWEQAGRVERTALALLRVAAPAWGLDPDESRRLLAWASRLLEIGLSISYNGYHKHGAYIVAHADMPGFSCEDQEMLAALLLAHRRKLSDAHFRGLSDGRAWTAKCLSVLLRIAACLHRGRRLRAVPRVQLSVRKNRLELKFPRGWLNRHPLTQADLEDERARLHTVGFELTMR
jgi:exopolyphosphatase/guanosine-5'-triphosphate,3'-diphosphate pyrophosphatase